MFMNKKDGNLLLKFARDCVYSQLFEKEIIITSQIKKYSDKQGCFVTIHKNGELRGCIGFVLGYYPLWEGIKFAALSAAFEDPRFPPLNKKEWDYLKFEISILSIPEEIMVKSPSEYPLKIKVGTDGLICESGNNKGLLLPQVAPEWEWNEEEFLNHTCEKAGLPGDFWKTGKVKIKKFQAQIFSE